MKLRSAVWFLIAFFAASAAWSEEPGAAFSSLAQGERVRLRLSGGKKLRGTLDAASPEAIVLRPEDSAKAPLRLLPADLERIEVARGRRSHWREGGLIGFVPGALFLGWAAAALACDDQGSDCDGYAGPALIGALVGGAATAGVGALVGLAVKTDRWVPVDGRGPTVSLRMAPTRGGLQAGVAIRF